MSSEPNAPRLPGLSLGHSTYNEMVAHCLRALPHEGCGLLIGDAITSEVRELYLTENDAASARLYAIPPLALLKADRHADKQASAIIGVFHSHTHTDPYPSPTDVNQAPDPGWHYVIVSLRLEVPSTRSFRIIGHSITEEELVLRESNDQTNTR